MRSTQPHPVRCAASRGVVFALCFSSLLPLRLPAEETAAVAEAAVPADADAVDTSFESLQATVKNLKASGEAINVSLTRCNIYLDTLGSSPALVAGKDLQAALAGVPDLQLQDWNNLVTANRSSMTDLLLKDSVVRQTMVDIQKEIVRIKTDIDRLEPQAKKVGDQAKVLGDEFKKMIKEKPWQAVTKGPMVMKFGGLAKDSTEVLQVARKSLIHCGEVMGKLGMASSLLPPGDPLVGELAAVNVPAPVAPGGGTSTPPVHLVQNGGFTGLWQENRSAGPRVQLLLGPAQAGQACGFVVVPHAGVERQVALVLREVGEEQRLYVDAGSGATFKVSPFKDQLILEVGKADGTSDSYFMKGL